MISLEDQPLRRGISARLWREIQQARMRGETVEISTTQPERWQRLAAEYGLTIRTPDDPTKGQPVEQPRIFGDTIDEYSSIFQTSLSRRPLHGPDVELETAARRTAASLNRLLDLVEGPHRDVSTMRRRRRATSEIENGATS